MVILVILDGWGVAPASDANAIAAAKTPTFLNLVKDYPVALLNSDHKTWNARYLTLGSGREIDNEKLETAISLPAIIAAAGLKQIKIAETERFAALTHFFNGHREDKFFGEDWKIISSTAGGKRVSPELALKRTVREVLSVINSEERPDFLAVAIPYLDLTAATGDFSANKKAVETVDKAIKNILAAVSAKGDILIITAAGGNVEKSRNLALDMSDIGLTDSPVPLVIVGTEFKGKTIGLADPLNNDLSSLTPAGTLADVAPTILRIMNLKKPDAMTGGSLM
jgi:2,3-bisphosphoglycerate-independent phosphoglycerate mutase